MQEGRLGQLLGTEEVAEYLGVGPVTVYRWCREGSLPCVKIGRRWRVRREALEEFVRKSERSETLTGRLRAFMEVPDNVLAIAQDLELMRRLDAAFFRVGAARGGTLIKYQLEDERMPSLEEVRAEMVEMGLEVDRLEDEGRVRLVSESGGLKGGLTRSGGWQPSPRKGVARCGPTSTGISAWASTRRSTSKGS